MAPTTPEASNAATSVVTRPPCVPSVAPPVVLPRPDGPPRLVKAWRRLGRLGRGKAAALSPHMRCHRSRRRRQLLALRTKPVVRPPRCPYTGQRSTPPGARTCHLRQWEHVNVVTRFASGRRNQTNPSRTRCIMLSLAIIEPHDIAVTLNQRDRKQGFVAPTVTFAGRSG